MQFTLRLEPSGGRRSKSCHNVDFEGAFQGGCENRLGLDLMRAILLSVYSIEVARTPSRIIPTFQRICNDENLVRPKSVEINRCFIITERATHEHLV